MLVCWSEAGGRQRRNAELIFYDHLFIFGDNDFGHATMKFMLIRFLSSYTALLRHIVCRLTGTYIRLGSLSIART